MSKINPNIRQILQKDHFVIKSLDHYLDGILVKRDPYVLSEAITLLESESSDHHSLARDILRHSYAHRVEGRRMGITGPPGVGKSSFIESFMSWNKSSTDRMAVLTIDPSSADTQGSILGDKTRMQSLATHSEVFIRPSPSRNFLGGTTRFTMEAIMMCEAAGYNRIVIETVGVGQSESDISHLVDIVIMLIAPGAGDELQGIKRGLLEVVDMMIVHKADGVMKEVAEQTLKDYTLGGHLKGDSIKMHLYSSILQEGKEVILQSLEEITKVKKESGLWDRRRQAQERHWIELSISRNLYDQLLIKLKGNTLYNELINAQKRSPADVMENYFRIMNDLTAEISWIRPSEQP